MPKHKESVNRACHYSSKLIIKFFSKEGKNELELFLPQQQKTAIQEDSGVRIVLLVAGAGFEPTLKRRNYISSPSPTHQTPRSEAQRAVQSSPPSAKVILK